MKSLVAEFVVYALAAFAVGVAVGILWQRRPIRLAQDRARRLEQLHRNMETRLQQSERDCASARGEVIDLLTIRARLSSMHTDMAEVVAERQAALAARDASEAHVKQLRADLDARPKHAFSAVSHAEVERQHNDELAALRSQHQREREADRSALLETMRTTERQLATVQEQLRSAERHLADLRAIHREHVQTAQAQLTAVALRAERAEAAAANYGELSKTVEAVSMPSVIDLRTDALANDRV